jgi:predicted dehydrogenase
MSETTQTARPPADDRPVRLGVIGAGWFASRRHFPDAVAAPNVQLVSLCRRDPDAAAKMAQKFEVPQDRVFSDWRQMLDSVEMDAVLIATPNALHFEQASAALRRGLHVLVEKPMTVRSEDGRALLKLARERGRLLAVALNPPHHAHCHRIRRALYSGKLGDVESISMYFSTAAGFVFGQAPPPANMPGVVPPTMYRMDPELNGGGYFIDGGSHLVSEILWTTGLRARKVACVMDALPTDMRVALSMEMENGAVASINTIGDSKTGRRRLQNMFGTTEGMITVRGFDFETCIMMPGEEQQLFHEEDSPPVPGPVRNLADAIQGHGVLFSPGEHGLHVVEVVEAAYESARTGKTIELAA